MVNWLKCNLVAVIALVLAVNANYIASRNYTENRQLARGTCTAGNKLRHGLNDRLEHTQNMTVVLTKFLEGAAEGRSNTAILLRAEEKAAEALINERLAEQYRLWSKQLRRTVEELVAHPLLDCVDGGEVPGTRAGAGSQ